MTGSRSIYPHFVRRCGPCGLMVSQTNECPGAKTCPNIVRDTPRAALDAPAAQPNPYAADDARATEAVEGEPCGCFACIGHRPASTNPNSWLTVGMTRMIVCAKCGNKRCPHATDHRNGCTGSNDTGQAGSRYGGLS